MKWRWLKLANGHDIKQRNAWHNNTKQQLSAQYVTEDDNYQYHDLTQLIIKCNEATAWMLSHHWLSQPKVTAYTVSQKKLGHFFTAYNFRNIEQIFTKFGTNQSLFILNIVPEFI